MQSLDERLIEQSKVAFGKFASGLSSVSPVGVGVTVAAAITPFLLYAGVMEVMHHQDILSTQGPEAAKQYMSLRPESAMAYLGQTLSQTLPSKWQNLFGASAVAAATLPALSGIGVYLAQSFGNLKRQVQELSEENARLSGRSGAPRPREESGRLSGATRVAADPGQPSPKAQFDASLDAFTRARDAHQAPREQATRIKGPSA